LSPEAENGKISAQNWLQTGIVVAMVTLLCSGLGVIRIPMKPLTSDAYRYSKEIEKEFDGQSAKDILLDIGTWVYTKDDVIMKDRAPCIGDQGYSETGDFSGMIERLQKKHYSKILVRNLHRPDFWYDYWTWRKPSGIKRALLENYHEVGRIKGVTKSDGTGRQVEISYTFGDISILVPNPSGN
jgi:hypothetical protein